MTLDIINIGATWKDIHEAESQPCYACGAQLEKIGSGRLGKAGFYIDMRCQDCGLWHTAREHHTKTIVISGECVRGRLFAVRKSR